LHACCGAIIKLNAKGSGSSGLDAVGLPEVFTESFLLLPSMQKYFVHVMILVEQSYK